ncbi:DUF4949 domain-containing protein [Legionella worsleiensis]|uniref:Hemin binding protein n=1 Tax=Legionella worsleiensis TaxID=45076 RepID=A0A0W1AEA9_9GAMM|nr:DUF4949 domain-containing protein [Legionella worsleiensis]KTD79665.1 hemin binding protein [Legionella worsleiensis]STY32175.1 hemin binding protein Hbp [Legionella worsleiensis]
MMFKSKLATFVSALVLAGSVFAAQDKPEKCPGMAALQAEGMTNAAEIIEGLYLTFNLSHYDTPSTWVFVMGPIDANSEDVSLRHSNEILASMSGTSTPEDDGEGSWLCEYQTRAPGVSAFAILADDMISPLKMARYLRKTR